MEVSLYFIVLQFNLCYTTEPLKAIANGLQIVPDGVFTPNGTRTETGTGTGTGIMGNNKSRPLSWFRCNVKASTQFHTTLLFPVPVPSASVNTPLEVSMLHLGLYKIRQILFFFRWSLYSRLYKRGKIYDLQRAARVGLLQIYRQWIHQPSDHL